MKIAPCCVVGLLAAVLTPFVQADKDSDYYYPGFTNPNTGNGMYWKDSVNVLQDLEKFDYLYVKYHRCVWSKYGMRYGSGEDYDEQGAEQDDADDDADTGCGSWGGEYFWYMGRTQCFKAQAAYSLYGVLAGETGKEVSGSLCNKHTYINSFFTTYGVESFAGPLGLGVDDVNAECQQGEGGGDNDGGNSGDGGNNNGDYDYAAADDDYLDDGFVFYNYADYTSTGIGCSAQGNFVQDQYKGAFCKGRNYQQTLDTLDDFNALVQGEECTQIYDRANYDAGSGDRRLEDEDYNFEDMDAVRILSFSKSCSLRQYPNDCPDPYGLKKKYANRIERAFAYKTGSKRNIAGTVMKVLSFVSLACGVMFMGAAIILQRNAAKRMLERKRRKKNRRSRAGPGEKLSSRSRSRSDDKKKKSGSRRSKSKDKVAAEEPPPEGYADASNLDRVASAASGVLSAGSDGTDASKKKKSRFSSGRKKNVQPETSP